MINLKIDPEFQSQIPPLTDDEFKQLEENILKEGNEVNLVLVPRCACLRLARFQLHTGAERHIADQDLAVLLQQRQQPVEKQHLLGVRQVVQRIGREDKIIALRAERLQQPLFEIAGIEFRIRHLLLRQLHHPLRKILPIHAAALCIEPGRQRPGAEADVQHISAAVCRHTVDDRVQDLLIAREGVAPRRVGVRDAPVIFIGPLVKTCVIQHGSSIN